MASLIESKHAERQENLLIQTVHACFSWTFARLPCASELSAAELLQWEVFVTAEWKGLFLSTYPTARAQANSSADMGLVVTLQAQLMLGFHGDGGMKCTWQPGCTVRVTILALFFVFCLFRQACLPNSAIQINTVWHAHTYWKFLHAAAQPPELLRPF